VARVTRLVAGAGGTAPNDGVLLLNEFTTVGALAPRQVLNFGSLAYVADCYGELRSLEEATPVDNESLGLSSPPGLLRADLEVLARQIWNSLGLNPIAVSERRQMF
jgi:hypothetical protein